MVPIEEQVDAVCRRRSGQQGKIGVNENKAWGATMFCRAAEQLEHRNRRPSKPVLPAEPEFRGDLAEVSYREQIPCWFATACLAWAADQQVSRRCGTGLDRFPSSAETMGGHIVAAGARRH